jgi:hypothetical protein
VLTISQKLGKINRGKKNEQTRAKTPLEHHYHGAR